MFLATTALTDFWDTSQPILFLGEWCRRRDRRADWETVKGTVLPCPWDDRRAMESAAEMLDEFSERLLSHAVQFLNSLHEVKFDVRYWRILIGSWLMHALHVYYDRYTVIKQALRVDPALTTFVLDRADYIRHPDGRAWPHLVTTDEFNLQLFSEIFELLGHSFPTRRGNLLAAPPSTLSSACRAGASRLLRRVVAASVALSPGSRRKRVLFHQMRDYLGLRASLRLAVNSKFRIYPVGSLDRPIRLTSISVEARRRKIAEFPATTEFERIFVSRLPDILPSAVVEEYGKLRPKAADAAILASYGGWWTNDAFQFLSAESQATGVALVAVQHGSGYGTLRLAPAERHERRVSDRFLAWGWARPEDPSSINLPAASMARICELDERRKTDEILYVATAHPRYLYRFHSTPVGPQWERYYDWQQRYLESTEISLYPNLRFRGHPAGVAFGQGERERLASRFHWLQWDGTRDMFSAMNRARLLVIDHSGTPLLQAMAANQPCIAFWEPGLWEMRDEAAPYFDELRNAGILFHDPDSAATATARINRDVERWWNSSAVVRARTSFANHYAMASPRWHDSWAAAFLRIAAHD